MLPYKFMENLEIYIQQFLFSEMDLRNTIKNGVLYLQDPLEKKWNPHFFVLTRNKLFYTECVNTPSDPDGEEETDTELDTSSISSLGRHKEVKSTAIHNLLVHVKLIYY